MVLVVTFATSSRVKHQISVIDGQQGRIAKKDIMNTTDTKTTEKTTSKTRELRRSMLAHVVKIGCEYHYSGALLSDGRMVTWGTNSHGQLGGSRIHQT